MPWVTRKRKTNKEKASDSEKEEKEKELQDESDRTSKTKSRKKVESDSDSEDSAKKPAKTSARSKRASARQTAKRKPKDSESERDSEESDKEEKKPTKKKSTAKKSKATKKQSVPSNRKRAKQSESEKDEEDVSNDSVTTSKSKEESNDNGYASNEDETTGISTDCPHLIDTIQFEAIKKKILNPSNWSCVECETTENVWACLTCGHIACGRYLKAHAEHHYKATGHAIVLEINAKLAHCYRCNNWVGNDDQEHNIERIRDFLEKAQSQSWGEEETDKKREIRAEIVACQPGAEDFKMQDKINTFMQRWRLIKLSKAFNSWKELAQRPKEEKDREREEEKKPRDFLTLSNDSVEEQKVEELEESPGTPKLPPIDTTPQKTKIPHGHTGLRNLGNTCFLNAVLQSLSNNEDFRYFFITSLLPANSDVMINRQTFTRTTTIECLRSLKQRKIPQLEQLTVSVQLHALLRVLWSGNWSVVTPFSLLEAVWKFVPKFKNFQQQDAEEFLVCLLDRLHYELNSKGPLLTPKAQMEATSIITDIFQGKLESQVKCDVCGYTSKKVEPFLNLPVNIPVVSLAKRLKRNEKRDALPTCTLEDCLASFSADEKLEKMWHCDKCNTTQDATKSVKFETLPNVLCLVLKRFSWTTTARAKVNTAVQFPLKKLNLAPFSTDTRNTFYDLESVIVHQGISLQSGHYTCYAYNHETESWIHFNDTRVKLVDEDEVEEAEAYMLVYQRRLGLELEFDSPPTLPLSLKHLSFNLPTKIDKTK